MSEDKFTEDQRLGVVERVGIKLDTPRMAQFWEAVEDYQEELKELCDELIEETASTIGEQIIKPLNEVLLVIDDSTGNEWTVDWDAYTNAKNKYDKLVTDQLQPYIGETND